MKLTATREESFLGHAHRHPTLLRYRHHADAEGKLVKVEAQILLDAGAYADTSAEALAACDGLSELHTLNLATNRIGDAGLSALAHSPHLRSLRTLHLGSTPITNRGVTDLLDSPLLGRLEVLMLNGTAISNEMRDRLRREFRGILG